MIDSHEPGVVVDQALHGYRHGHRLLAASTSFDPASEAQLLALSDLLTSEPLGPTDSYLSGYPLKSANKYVLARTWLAREYGARPGSVWTHSLLLDYSSLSALDDVMPLLSLFLRPGAEVDNSAFAVRLRVRRHGGVESQQAPSVADDVRVPRVLRHLYGHASVGHFVIPASDSARDERLAMAVWRQMWPSLRRDFAFFTKSTAALAEVSVSSALCFSSDLGLVSTFNSRALLVDKYEAEGFERLQRDLPRRGPTQLRRFLGRYAYDSGRPRAVVPALATLYSKRKKPSEALSAFDSFLNTYPGFDRLKRELLLLCIKAPRDTESLVRAIELFASESSFVSTKALEDALQKSPMVEPNAARLLDTAFRARDDTVGHQVFTALARQLPLQVLASIAQIKTSARLLSLRSELAGQPMFWETTEEARSILAMQAITAGIDGATLLEGIGPTLSLHEAQTLLAYEPTLALPLCRMVEGGRAPLRVAESLGVIPGILQQLADSGSAASLQVLEKIAESLVQAGRVGKADDWWKVVQHLKQAPDMAYPYVLAQFFLAGLDSHKKVHLSLCELAFDSLWSISEKYPGIPREFTALLRVRPMAREEYTYPDLLISTAWMRYRKSDCGRVMALSANGSRLSQVARYIRRCDGENALQQIAVQLQRDPSRLRLPLGLVEVALDDAMPIFSAKLPRGPKR